MLKCSRCSTFEHLNILNTQRTFLMKRERQMEKKEVNKEKKLVGLREMAEILNCCEKTLRKYIKEYDIPYIKLGRSLRFDVREVENYLKEFTVATQDSSTNENTDFVAPKTKRNFSKSDKSTDRYESMLGLR